LLCNVLTAINTFHYCVVYDPKEGKLRPLHAFEHGQLPTDDVWGQMIGFDHAPINYLPASVHSKLKEAYYLQDCSFWNNGNALPPYPKGPTYLNGDTGVNHNPGIPEGQTTELPPFAVLDFTHCLLKCCPNEVLYAYLAAHGCTSLRDETHEALEAEVTQRINNPVLQPERVIQQISKWSIHEVLELDECQDWSELWWNLLTNPGGVGTVNQLYLVSSRNCTHMGMRMCLTELRSCLIVVTFTYKLSNVASVSPDIMPLQNWSFAAFVFLHRSPIQRRKGNKKTVTTMLWMLMQEKSMMMIRQLDGHWYLESIRGNTW